TFRFINYEDIIMYFAIMKTLILCIFILLTGVYTPDIIDKVNDDLTLLLMKHQVSFYMYTYEYMG
ncbi:hypothetical protein QII58_gp1, partial [ssRNA phage SRR5466364_2]